MSHAAEQRSKLVLWDLMDTLVSDPFFEHMPRFFGITFEELLAQKHPTLWGDFELGRVDEDEMIARFFRDERRFDGAAFKAHVAQHYRWIEGIEPLLAELLDRGVEMHLLSNYPHWYTLCTERLGVDRYVAPTFVSCKTGVRKPDPEAFLGPCRALGVSPEQCVFVDDRESNCRAARELGLHAHRFDGDVGALRVALETHRLL